MAKQCYAILRPLAFSAKEAQALRTEADRQADKESESFETAIEGVQSDIDKVQMKLTKLARGYVDEVIEEENYEAAKAELILEKTSLKAKKEQLRRSHSNFWFEPTKEAINALETLGKLESEISLKEMSTLVQKIVTNPQISGKKVTCSFASPYDFIQCLRASDEVSKLPASASNEKANSESTKWCRTVARLRTLFSAKQHP